MWYYRNKIVSIIFAGFILTGAVVYGNENVWKLPRGQTQAPDPVGAAMVTAGARQTELNLQAWGRVNQTYQTLTQLEEIAHQAAAALAGQQPLQYRRVAVQGFRNVTADGLIAPDTYVYLSVQSLEAPPAAVATAPVPATFLLAEVTLKGEHHTAPLWRHRLVQVFHPGESTPQLALTLTGTIPGQLNEPQRTAKMKAMFRAAGARRVEAVADGDLSSYSGYTPDLPQYVLVGVRKINFNVAFRYHSNDDQTYILVGTPLLNGEY